MRFMSNTQLRKP